MKSGKWKRRAREAVVHMDGVRAMVHVDRVRAVRGCLVVEPKGKSRGLALLWREEVELEVINFSRHHISAQVLFGRRRMPWILSGFYGHPEVSRRKYTWNLLSILKPTNDLAWCVIGDFNEIISQAEKEGSRPRSESQMEDFRQCLEGNGLYDLGWKGLKFTWSNKHSDESFTKERLDRALGNNRWMELCYESQVETLTTSQSDHLPIMVTIRDEVVAIKRRKKCFRFEVKWTLEEEGGKIVKDSWVRSLSENKFLAEEELGVLLEKEDLKWKQRAKRNCQRRKKNWIKEIKNTQGQILSEQQQIEKVFFQHFTSTFSSSRPSEVAIAKCVRAVESRVTCDMNAELLKEFHMTEVEEALKQMGPLKSPGPDGFGAYFYQAYWNIIGKELVSKVLADRLKKILPFIISNSQSAFIPERLITDNIMVAYEALHTMKTRLKGKMGRMAIKLDIFKTYDKIEWREVLKPERGIRQGDPISPYLFLLCAEGLSSLLESAERQGEIRGVAFAKGGVQIQQMVGVATCGSYEKYLGLPALVGRSRYNTFKSLKEREDACVQQLIEGSRGTWKKDLIE
ncbi:uncharacterized protein LOC122290887 [Carya illinoinensis]|uniref:uncharacterized protein LOC122290887 n=1 Tax=Carya illinoinensis TaxID=32201 RepID=UPI001C720151|nr:uncharacterized protein LOC122290887 [Carya illinoinensis]